MIGDKINNWLKAFRLRTLPLALSCIGMGGGLAYAYGNFNFTIFLLSISTTILLQVLSNLANDYGDAQNGADHNERKGPKRMVQSGQISTKSMIAAMIFAGALALVSGIALIYMAFGFSAGFWIFLGLGLLAIVAAVTYTAGKNPYGYIGLGDISVFVFFGIIGVVGSFFLHTGQFETIVLLPAFSCGFFATAVLNINNIRDIEADQMAGKRSIPVRIGQDAAKMYHWALIILGLFSAIVYTIIAYRTPFQFVFLLSIPLFIRNGVIVTQTKQLELLDPFLKQLVLSTLFFVLLFGIGILF